MNPNIQSLISISQKSVRNIIGLMSGTSLDGLDVAYCKISGSGTSTKAEVVHFTTFPYDEETKSEIRKVFAQKTIDFQHLALLNEWIGIKHGKIVLDCLQQWKLNTTDVDLIASHGQTVMHAPKSLHQQDKFPNATLQIGDGDHLAVTTQCITVSDFRQKHLAAGGEGAPLAVYGDYFLFNSTTENRILLNIGGIANFTLLPKSGSFDSIFVTDTGTGNTLMDAYTRLHFTDLDYDIDAAIAKTGNVNQSLLEQLKSDSFFSAKFPKSTGPELFSLTFLDNALNQSNTTSLKVADVLATLTLFTAETIAEAILKVTAKQIDKNTATTVYISGGGFHNPLLMQYLKELLPFSFASTTSLGINGDAKEALLFAILANETISGSLNSSKKNNSIPMVSMGKICFPN
ncbi:MAG: anhydro-N-acetylmuramic acid kinase [Flavobacterium sp.]|nr:MAG: anhydro-N-acetylmuramic acid kinase [Flavobacterium sp.]